MTNAVSKSQRAVPPPLPSQKPQEPGGATTSVSGVRPIPQMSEAVAPATLKQILLRVDVSRPREDAESAEDRHTLWDSEQSVEFLSESQFVSDMSPDVPASGVFLATYRSVPVGTKVHLRFELPTGEGVDARGVVRWTTEDGHSAGRPGFGVLFTEVSDRALATISDLCRARPPLYFEI